MASSEEIHGFRQAMVVEDDPVFQRAIGQALARLGNNWLIQSYRTGTEALEACQDESSPPTLALVDLGLPDMPGETVIQGLRARYANLPILVISVFSDEQKVLSAIRAGAMGYLLKGDDGFEMTAAIRQALEGNFPISPMLARYLFKLAGKCGAPASPEAPKLSLRELELLGNISEGRSYEEAAQAMNIAPSTVRSYSRELFRKLNCHSQTQALVRAREYRLLD